jgi:predicted amino acid dehydrogenase
LIFGKKKDGLKKKNFLKIPKDDGAWKKKSALWSKRDRVRGVRKTTGAVHGGILMDMCLMKEKFEKKKDGLKKRNI